jgi:hypothetical protein
MKFIFTSLYILFTEHILKHNTVLHNTLILNYDSKLCCRFQNVYNTDLCIYYSYKRNHNKKFLEFMHGFDVLRIKLCTYTNVLIVTAEKKIEIYIKRIKIS